MARTQNPSIRPSKPNYELTFLQSSFFVHYNLDRFASLHSNLDEDIFVLPVAAVVVPELPERRPAVEPDALVAVEALILLARQEHQHIAVAVAAAVAAAAVVVVAAGLDTSSLAHDFAAAVRIECAA